MRHRPAMSPRIEVGGCTLVEIRPKTAPPVIGRLVYLRSMQIVLAHIGSRPSAKDPLEALTEMYLQRISAYTRSGSECFRDQTALFTWIDRQQKRAPAISVLLDSRGRQLSSEAFAQWLGGQRDTAVQMVVFAIGPADGWTESSRQRASLLLSLGPMTFAHLLARLIVAEQVYRAFTILTGHPYHAGH